MPAEIAGMGVLAVIRDWLLQNNHRFYSIRMPFFRKAPP